jgi:hypothetical protein
MALTGDSDRQAGKAMLDNKAVGKNNTTFYGTPGSNPTIVVTKKGLF